MAARSAQNQKTHIELEKALRTYPLVPAPPSLSRSVMWAVGSSTPKPHFRLSWFDYALTFFMTSMVGLISILAGMLPSEWMMLMRLQAIILWERSMRFSAAPFLIIGCAFALVIVTNALLSQGRPRLSSTPQ